MTTSEREMIRPLNESAEQQTTERSTSLQPTYEDSVAPSPENEWIEDD